MRNVLLTIVLVLSITLVRDAKAEEPGWWGVVFATGIDKERIDNTPVHARPYRPFHFYGNTVRREYYRGNPLPMPRDLINGAHALLFERELYLPLEHRTIWEE